MASSLLYTYAAPRHAQAMAWLTGKGFDVSAFPVDHEGLVTKPVHVLGVCVRVETAVIKRRTKGVRHVGWKVTVTS